MGFIDVMMKMNRASSGEEQNRMLTCLKEAGLEQDGEKSFSGTYLGFPTTLTCGLSVNTPYMAMQGLAGLATGGMSMGGHQSRHMLNQKFEIEMELPKDVPPLVLKEKVGILRTDKYITDLINKKGVELPEIKLSDIKLKRARIFGTDEAFARQIASNPELQQLLKKWHFLDARFEGNRLKFTLDDPQIQNQFGSKRAGKPDFVMESLHLCGVLAKSV